MRKRVGVISNPRSGTSLMVRLLVLGFDLTGTLPLFPHLDGKDVYEYRSTPEDIRNAGDNDYRLIHIIRDPRSVITSRHPSDKDNFMVNFEEWQTNYNNSVSLGKNVHLCRVNYEQLLKYPDETQLLISKSLGLNTISPFSVCAHQGTHTLKRWKEMSKEMGSPRPLDTSLIDRWKLPHFNLRIRNQLRKYPHLPDMLISLGYEFNKDWTREYNV